MKTNKPTTLKVSPEQLEKLVEFVRRSGRPQTLEALTRRYIDILKEKQAGSNR